jgi:predicted dehydrogenase
MAAHLSPGGRRARIGVVGAGWWSTQFHIPTLLSDDRAQIVGVADIDADRRSAVSRAFGIETVFADHHALLTESEPEGVVIAVPHAWHYPVARDALAAGAHVLVEKPMTLTSRDAWALVHRARDHGRHLTVGYPWNYTSHARAVRELIAGGRVGDIQLVTGLFASMVVELFRGNPEVYRPSFKFPVTGPRPETYADPAVAGGGQGHLQVTHLAALMLWETGLRPTRVFSMMQSFDVSVDLVDAICVQFAGGAIGTLASTGNTSPGQRQHHEIRIFGTRGSIAHDPMAGTLSFHPAQGTPRTFPPLPPDEIYPVAATTRNLVDLVLGGAGSCASGVTGAKTVDLLDAAYRSARYGLPVDVADSCVA